MDPKLKERLELILNNLDANEIEVPDRHHKRSSARHTFRTTCKTRYIEVRNGKMFFSNSIHPLIGLSRNLSCGGMSILCRKWFTQGDILESEVILNKMHPVFFLGVVAYSRLCGNNMFETGMQFYDYRDSPILTGNFNNVEVEIRQIIKAVRTGQTAPQKPTNDNKLMNPDMYLPT